MLPQSASQPPLSLALDRVSTRDVLSSTTGTLAGGNATSVTIVFAGLSAADAQLGQALVVHAECTWGVTGERARLPPLPLTVVSLRLQWRAPPSRGLGYWTQMFGTDAVVVAPATAGSPAVIARCALALVNASSRGVAVVSDAWEMSLAADAPAGTMVSSAIAASLSAPPGTSLFLSATCAVWGGTITTPPLPFAIATLQLRNVSSRLPATFIASDASSPWPLDPPLAVQVTPADGGGEVVTDVTCSVTTPTTGAELVTTGASGSSSLQSLAADAASGVVDVPPFLIHTAPSAAAVTIAVECRRAASGDVAPQLVFVVAAVRLTAAMCVPPASKSAVSVPLPSFAVDIVATLPAGGGDVDPCTIGVGGSVTAVALPPIVCSIVLAATTNDTASIFLQHTVATVDATTHTATFDAFTVVAPQGASYALNLSCAVGGLAIPPTARFEVALAGCAPGQASVSVACVTCGGGAFSLGGEAATCRGCPPLGAVCDTGILTLLPRYFRPASQAGQPLGPDTELHPCYNAEACTLSYGGNDSSAVYGCTAGYSGPLCGVCDAAANYARFGEACSVCWDPAASWVFLGAVLAVLGGVLTRVALRTDTSRSDASIVLRIALGYLQAVGSLRVFRAGSTRAYGSVMGWTEVVSASPLSVGALQCILRLPYLFQYAAIVALPAIAAVAVVVIFLLATVGRATACGRAHCGVDTQKLRAAVAAWWSSRRHLSTALFVLFLAYMPIISASLRALDCIDPVAGVKYLRSDLSVQCGVGEHAVARVLAYAVLVAVGVGFPAGLAWLLGTARNEQLADEGFHATWGFLFDGYRAPTRTLVASPTPAAGGTGDTTGKSAAKVQSVDAATGTSPGAAAGRGRRRSSIMMPERLTQAWVVAGDSRVWWEAIVLCRKAGVVLLAVTVTNPYLQCVGATLWFAAAAVLQARYAPYTKRLFNSLEMASLVVTFLTAVVSTALLQFNVGVTTAELHGAADMTAIEWVVTVALVGLNLGAFVSIAALWVRLQCARAHGALQRTKVVRALSSSRGRSGEPDGGFGFVGSTVNPLHLRGVPAAVRLPAPSVDGDGKSVPWVAAGVRKPARGTMARIGLPPMTTTGVGGSGAIPAVMQPEFVRGGLAVCH